jgi:uncharacterized protein YjbI with pentapeptide repeats
MASSSSIRPARAGSLGTIRFGAAARWWRVQRGDLAKDALIGVVVGVLLLLGAFWWDAKLQARQDKLSSAIADRQDALARDLANQAEVLENTRFVRQIATSKGKTKKPFASINLRGAELGGLDLRCMNTVEHVGCADFTKADLGEADLRLTDLGGADFTEADLHEATLDKADFTSARFDRANLSGVVTTDRFSADFFLAHLYKATLVRARLEHGYFPEAKLTWGNADEAVLSRAEFYGANLRGTRFKHADLRNANFREANMTRVDLTSADLRGADFTHADLREAVLTDVCFNAKTKWGSNPLPTSSSC